MTDRRGFFGRMAGAVMALVGVSSTATAGLVTRVGWSRGTVLFPPKGYVVGGHLEAVGQDAAGEIVPINELSYEPSEGVAISNYQDGKNVLVFIKDEPSIGLLVSTNSTPELFSARILSASEMVRYWQKNRKRRRRLETTHRYVGKNTNYLFAAENWEPKWA